MLPCHGFFRNSLFRILNELKFHSLAQKDGSAADTDIVEILSQLTSYCKIMAYSLGKVLQITVPLDLIQQIFFGESLGSQTQWPIELSV